MKPIEYSTDEENTTKKLIEYLTDDEDDECMFVDPGYSIVPTTKSQLEEGRTKSDKLERFVYGLGALSFINISCNSY